MIFSKINNQDYKKLLCRTNVINENSSFYDVFKYLIDKEYIYVEVCHNKHGWYYRIYDIETNEFITQGDEYYDNYETALIEGVKEFINFWL